MTRRAVTTNSFNAVAPGQRAILDLPVGDLIYHEIRLRYRTSTAGGATQANTEAEITKIGLKVNGKTQVELSAAQLIKLNALHGRAFNTDATGDGAQLPIFLSQPWRRSAQGEDSLAWATGDVSTFQVEVDIAPGATSPILDCKVVVETGRRPMGPIVKLRPFTVPVTATGITTITTFPKNDDYYALYNFSADVLDVEVKVDQVEQFKLISDELAWLLEDHEFTPQTALFPVKFDFTKRVADSLRMRRPDGSPISEFRVDYNMGAANSFTAVTETVGLRD